MFNTCILSNAYFDYTSIKCLFLSSPQTVSTIQITLPLQVFAPLKATAWALVLKTIIYI